MILGRAAWAVAGLLAAGCTRDVVLARAYTDDDDDVVDAAPVDAVTADTMPPTGWESTELHAQATDTQLGSGDDREQRSQLEVVLSRHGSPLVGQRIHADLSGVIRDLVTDADGRAQYAWSLPVASVTLEFSAGDGGAAHRLSATAPTAHTFLSPRDRETHVAGEPLEVRWSPSGADQARLVAPILLDPVADTGALVAPGGAFVRGRILDVRIRRSRLAPVPGFAEGSTFALHVERERHVVVP